MRNFHAYSYYGVEMKLSVVCGDEQGGSMAKKIFKMENNENLPAQSVASAGAPAVPVKEVSEPSAETDSHKNTTPNSADSTIPSHARTVSDKYSADLLVKSLLKKDTASSAESGMPKEIAAPDSASSEKAVADSEKHKVTAEQKTPSPAESEKAKDVIIASDPTKLKAEENAEKISSGTKQPEEKKQPSADEKPVKKDCAKEVSEKYSADLIVSAMFKGETSPLAAMPQVQTAESETPKAKNVFRIVTVGDPPPTDLEVVDQPPKAGKEDLAEKHTAKKASKEIPPAAASEKKQPTTFIRVLKGIYRVTVTTFKALLLTVPFLATIAYTNMYVDPGRLYHIDREDMFEYDIVRIMREGYNVENIDNYNERLVKREYINQMEEPVDVIIAGSSRGALITKEMLNVDSMFNTSVAGGSLDDVIGFYGVLHQYDLLPETFIIVFDPWMLNDNHYDNRYERSIGDGYYNYMTSRMGYSVDESLKEIDSIYEPGSDEPISFWDLSDDVKWNLISITYFQASIQRYLSANTIVRPDTWPVATESDNGESAFLRPDGSFCYPLDYRLATVEEASYRARMSFPESIIGFEDYTVMESNRKQIFIDFLKCVQEDGVEVKIVIEPISNIIVEYMKVFERYENFFKIEAMIYDIAASFGIEITGSFDPEKLKYDMTCFYDGYHLKEQYIAEIVKPFRQ